MSNLESQNTKHTPFILKIEKDLVSIHSAELRENLRDLISQGTRSVVLDFKLVRMVDSSGLGMIIAAHNSMKKLDGELAVVGCSVEILELFHSMRIHQHIRVEGAAVASA